MIGDAVYSMGHASKAILPRDVGGPFGQRIGVTVGGSLNWALRVGAYVTGRVSSTDWDRYSLVVMNWYVGFQCHHATIPLMLLLRALCRNDNSTGTWDPQPVQTTIEFRDMQARPLQLLSFLFYWS